MYKRSNYNYIVQKKSIVFIYNTLHRSFVALSKEVWNAVESQQWSLLSDYETSLLLRQGILLRSELNEIYIFKDIIQNAILRSDCMGIFLSMTSDCNLSCPYCYQDYRKETQSKRYISEDKINTLCDFIKNSDVRELSIVYFGGEPTINEDVLLYAMRKINSLEGVKVGNTLITNGYAVSKNLIDAIKQYGSFLLQITFDGNKMLHDSIRVTSDRGPTFDVIYDNLIVLADELPQKVNIRINIYSKDLTTYKSLVDDLYDRFENKISIYFDLIFDGQKKKNCNDVHNLTDIMELINHSRARGFPIKLKLEKAPCVIHSRNSFALDENLKAYVCPGKLYCDSIGNITDDSKFEITDNEWFRYIYDPSPCVYNCLYGALCYGGCIMNNHKCRKDDFVELLPVIVEDKITEYYKRAAL